MKTLVLVGLFSAALWATTVIPTLNVQLVPDTPSATAVTFSQDAAALAQPGPCPWVPGPPTGNCPW